VWHISDSINKSQAHQPAGLLIDLCDDFPGARCINAGKRSLATVSLPGPSLRLPHGRAVLEELLLLHKIAKAGLGEEASGDTPRMAECIP
jgi:hypothetical protein